MQIKVRYLDNLRLEASFDDFKVIADQPIRYKGDGTAPGPFDYFLASSALCAAYFVKVYCEARNIPTDDISITQDNIVDPDNRYQQTFRIRAEIPESLSEKDRLGIINSIDRCTVKRVVQNNPTFLIDAVTVLGKDSGLLYVSDSNAQSETKIIGKDLSLEQTIRNMTSLIESLGIKLEVASWRNIVPHVWSVHIRDADSPMCFTNGKGSTKDAALCSALGEYLERLSNNYFYSNFYLGEEIANEEFVHYPSEKWFPLPKNGSLPKGLLDANFLRIYNHHKELKGFHLIDTNTGRSDRGICAVPFVRQSDQETVYVPTNLIANLFVSNGMSAGNTKYEARVQALSEIIERAVKNKIITEEITLPSVPKEILTKFPKIVEGIQKLESEGFPILIKDASLGGRFPVMCVTLKNPKTGGVFASFGSHPNFEVALERSLTELMQGRSFEGMNDVPPPTFNINAVTEPNNIVDHFIDSTGVISWKFFSEVADYEFIHWNFSGTTQDEFDYLMEIFKNIEKEVYIADYEELGVNSCRIIVPDYSEIYEADDLIWDNHNKALDFRSDILNLHQLNNDELQSLIERFDESELDENMPVGELIGIAFDDNSVWEKCSIGELKILIHLALQNVDDAKSSTEMIIAFNDMLPERRKFYQVLNNILDILLNEELVLDHYIPSLTRMYGEELLNNALSTASGEARFFGLAPTNMQLEGIEKHQRLIESYKKLHRARKKS